MSLPSPLADQAPRRRWRRNTIVVVLALVAGLLVIANARKPSLDEVKGFGSNPGALKMFEFVPAGLDKHRPLVVLIHGCLAKASDIDNESGWTRWAEEYQFALLLPQQDPANNRRRCFNGFLPGDQERDKGEPLSIRQMTEWMLKKHDLDRDRVFVNGLSAGGVMTGVMLATYPDVYKAGASIAAVRSNARQVDRRLGAATPGSGSSRRSSGATRCAPPLRGRDRGHGSRSGTAQRTARSTCRCSPRP